MVYAIRSHDLWELPRLFRQALLGSYPMDCPHTANAVRRKLPVPDRVYPLTHPRSLVTMGIRETREFTVPSELGFAGNCNQT